MEDYNHVVSVTAWKKKKPSIYRLNVGLFILTAAATASAFCSKQLKEKKVIVKISIVIKI